MPPLSVLELLIIMAIIILGFGVGKLPQIGKALRQGIREFREGTQGLVEEVGSEASPGEAGKA